MVNESPGKRSERGLEVGRNGGQARGDEQRLEWGSMMGTGQEVL